MQLSAAKRQIGEHTFEVSMLMLGEWRDLQVRVWPIIVGLLPDIVEETKLDKEKLIDVCKAASVMLPLQPEVYDKVLEALSKCTRVSDYKGYLAQHSETFWAEVGYSHLAEFIAFGLEVQLVPFLSGLPLDALKRLQSTAEANRHPSQRALTGMSGGSFGGGGAL